MPCTDDSRAQSEWEAKQRGHMPPDQSSRIATAMLCGLLRVARENKEFRDLLFASVDWTEAGISQDDVVRWWKEHQERDGG